MPNVPSGKYASVPLSKIMKRLFKKFKTVLAQNLASTKITKKSGKN